MVRSRFDLGIITVAPAGNFGSAAGTVKAPGNARKAVSVRQLGGVSRVLLGPANQYRWPRRFDRRGDLVA
jgi:hypothetical protein